MQDLLELVVSATASGCIYGLLALSYLLMTRPTGIINFSVGEWAMVGAFTGFVLLSAFEVPYFAGAVVVAAVMGCVGWFTERFAVRPLVQRNAPLLAPILSLLGMLVVFRELVSVGFGPDPRPVPGAFGFGRLELGLLAGSYQSFFIIAVTLLVFLGVWLFFERTLAGRSFEAVAIDRRAAAQGKREFMTPSIDRCSRRRAEAARRPVPSVEWEIGNRGQTADLRELDERGVTATPDSGSARTPRAVERVNEHRLESEGEEGIERAVAAIGDGGSVARDAVLLEHIRDDRAGFGGPDGPLEGIRRDERAHQSFSTGA